MRISLACASRARDFLLMGIMATRGNRGPAMVCVFACGAFAACGLDESGLAGDASVDVILTDAATPTDSSITDASLPPSCATTDVSCLGFDAGLPDGWSAYVVEVDGGACPSADYAGSTLQANPRLGVGACACTCNAVGAWSCPSTITLANGGGCGTTFTVDAGVCNPQEPQSSHIKLPTAPPAGGTVTCAGDASAPIVTTDSVMLCGAGCDAGASAICAQPVGQRCIGADGIQPCPSPSFTRHLVGSGASASCASCGCQPSAPPTCSANAHVYLGYDNQGYHANNGCFTGGQWQSQNLTLDNTCQAANANYDSFDVEWAPLPAPTCTPSGAGGGDAGLTSPKTLCCN